MASTVAGTKKCRLGCSDQDAAVFTADADADAHNTSTPEQQRLRPLRSSDDDDDDDDVAGEDVEHIHEEEDGADDGNDASRITKWGTPSRTLPSLVPSSLHPSRVQSRVQSRMNSPSESSQQQKQRTERQHQNKEKEIVNCNRLAGVTAAAAAHPSPSSENNIDRSTEHDGTPALLGDTTNQTQTSLLAPPPEIELHLDTIIQREERFFRNNYNYGADGQEEGGAIFSFSMSGDGGGHDLPANDIERRWAALFRDCVDKAAQVVDKVGLYQRTFHLGVVILRAVFHHQHYQHHCRITNSDSGSNTNTNTEEKTSSLLHSSALAVFFDPTSSLQLLNETNAVATASSTKIKTNRKKSSSTTAASVSTQMQNYIKCLLVNVALLLASKMEEEEPLTVEFIAKKQLPAAASRAALTYLTVTGRGGTETPGVVMMTAVDVISLLEREMAALLRFNFTVPTPYSILDVLFVVGDITTPHQQWASLLSDVTAAHILRLSAPSEVEGLEAETDGRHGGKEGKGKSRKKRSRSLEKTASGAVSPSTSPTTTATLHRYYLESNNATLVALGCLQVAAFVLANVQSEDVVDVGTSHACSATECWRWSQCVSAASAVSSKPPAATTALTSAEINDASDSTGPALAETQRTTSCCWYGFGDSVLYGRQQPPTESLPSTSSPLPSLPDDETILRKALQIVSIIQQTVVDKGMPHVWRRYANPENGALMKKVQKDVDWEAVTAQIQAAVAAPLSSCR